MTKDACQICLDYGKLKLLTIWLLTLVLFLLSYPVFASSEIQQLADEAKNRFSQVVTPPIHQYPLVSYVVELEPGFTHREYVVQSFNQAIESLLQEANKPNRLETVTSALRSLVKNRSTDPIDRVFQEMLQRAQLQQLKPNPLAAAVLRYSVALVELAPALQQTLFPSLSPALLSPFVSIINGRVISDSQIKSVPLEKTLSAYRQAALFDPNNIWTWIILSRLEPKFQEAIDGLTQAEKVTKAAKNLHALVFIKRELGQLLFKYQQPGVWQAFQEAVQIALIESSKQPEDLTWKQELAGGYSFLGRYFIGSESDVKSRNDALNALKQAASIYHELAATNPDNQRIMLHLAVAHAWLANAHRMISGGKIENTESKQQQAEAERIFNELVSPDAYKPTLDVNSGAIISVLGLAGVLTLIVGLGLMWFYRRAIKRYMLTAASKQKVDYFAAERIKSPLDLPAQRMAWSFQTIQSNQDKGQFTSSQLASADQTFRLTACIYIAGALIFSVIASALMLFGQQVDLNFSRFSIYVLIYFWPIVFSLWFFFGPHRKNLIFIFSAYIGVLLMFCIRQYWLDTPAINLYGITVEGFYQPILMVLMMTSSISFFLLFFMNRYVRAVGPVILLSMLIVSSGILCMQLILSSRKGAELWISLVASLENLFNIQPGFSLAFWLIFPVAAALMLPIAYRLIVLFCHRYQEKRFSEIILLNDAIWLLQTYFLCQELSNGEGLFFMSGLSAFVGYKLVTFFGLRILGRKYADRIPARLLVLRVFNRERKQRRRVERFFKLLEARWRYAGSIQLIAAPDLASSTIDPGDFLAFINRKLREKYIFEPNDVKDRLATLDYLPDPDGRFRVNEVYCGNDTWRLVVQQLMAENDLIVMDLRYFSKNNQGCIFELQSLVDYVSFAKIVFLVNQDTDVDFLKQVIADRLQHTEQTSPNSAGVGNVSILKVGKSDESAAETLFEYADNLLSVRKRSY
jgi:hypothetical protein